MGWDEDVACFKELHVAKCTLISTVNPERGVYSSENILAPAGSRRLIARWAFGNACRRFKHSEARVSSHKSAKPELGTSTPASSVPHEPPQPLPHLLYLRLQLGVRVLPEIQELVVVLDCLFTLTPPFIQLTQPTVRQGQESVLFENA